MKVKVVDDKARVEEIRKALEDNDGYCPCKLIKNVDTKCMCREFREQMAAGLLGECHCGLYEVVDE